MKTRREIIKSGLGLAGIIAAGKAPAALVRSLVSARAALTGGRKRLPYDAEVAYLQSDGAQYINTGILANGEFDFDYMFRLNTLSNNTVGMGARSASQFLTVLQVNQSMDFVFAYLGTLWNNGNWDVFAGIDYSVQLHFHNGSQSATVDGNTLFTDSKVGVEALNLPIYIFKRSNSATESVSGLNGRFYYCKIYLSGVLVRDFVSVRFTNELGQSEGAMYDRVSGQLFRNQGTGAFVIGPVKARGASVQSGASVQNGGGYKWLIIVSDSGAFWRPHLQRWRQLPSSWKEAA